MKKTPSPAPSLPGRVTAGFALAALAQGSQGTLLWVGIAAAAALALLVWLARRRRPEIADSLLPPAPPAPPGADFAATQIEGAATTAARRGVASPGLHGKIEVIVGGQTISQFLVTDNPLPIGRDPAQALVIVQEPIVSKLHCQIFSRDGQVFVKDLQSTNGVYVNEVKVGEKRLEDGDVIFLGKKGTVKIVYHR